MKKVFVVMVTVVLILSLSVPVMAGPSFEYNDYCSDDDIIYYDDCAEDEIIYYDDSEDCEDEIIYYDDYSDCDEDEIIYYDDYSDCDEDEIIYFENDCECNSYSYMTVMSAANVRSGPGTNYCVIGSVSEGDVVAIVGEGDGCDGLHWYKTKCGGYIYSGAFEVTCSETYSEDSCDESEYYNAVVINIENQTVKLYKHGECVCTSSCVTGTEGVYDTPKGEFEIYEKSENRELTGKDYCVTVKYWMAFEGGCGLHDGDNWRSNYGGDIYQTNGSHGCVNLPEWMAETIYKSCPVGTAVIVE